MKGDFAGFTELSTKASSWLPPPSVLCSKQIMHCCPRLAALVMRFDHVENNHSLAPLFSGCSRAVTMPVLTNPPVGQTYKTHLVPHAPKCILPDASNRIAIFSYSLFLSTSHNHAHLHCPKSPATATAPIQCRRIPLFLPAIRPSKQKRSATKTKILSTATPCCDHKAAKRVAIFHS